MKKVAVVTDSVACLPPELVRKYDIVAVPFQIAVGRRIFKDGMEPDIEEFYQLIRDPQLPLTTSQPSVGDFVKAYTELSQEAEAIISIHIPRELSGTISSAEAAKNIVTHSLASMPIQIIDCRTAAMAEGFIALAAARAAAAGASLAEVVERVEAMISEVDCFAVVDTLEHLYRIGRINRAMALMGSTLQIKPILYINDGRIDALYKVRTKAKALRRLVEIMRERVGERPVHVAISHADALDEAKSLGQELLSRFNCVEMYITPFSLVMVAAAGPGVVALSFYSDN